METAGDVARAALAAVDQSANLQLATQWCSERYAQLAARLRLRHLRRVGAFTIPAALRDGTVSAVSGSDLLTGDATAQAAWTTALVGRWVRVRTAWYEIKAVEQGASTALRLTLPYAEDAASGMAYTIVQRYAQLAPRARWAGHYVATRLWAPLEQRSLGELEMLAPGREYQLGLAAGGGIVADIGELDGRRRVEVWPYSSRDEPVAYVYYEKPGDLQVEDLLPESVDAYVLKQGVLIDVYRNAAMAAAQAGKLDLAATLGNWEQRAEVRWNDVMLEASRSDRGADDSTFLLAHRGRFAGPRSIRTAEDEIFARGARP